MINLNFLLNFIFPTSCLICQKEGDQLCSSCEKNLIVSPKKKILKPNLPVFSISSYHNDQIKKLIAVYKFHSQPELAKPLGRLVKKAIDSSPELTAIFQEQRSILIPVPLSIKRLRQRGYNQSDLLAQEIASYTGQKIWNYLKKENRPPQSEQKAGNRDTNIIGAFSWHGENLSQKTVIIIDDVTTTGATLKEVARTLSPQKPQRIFGFTIAS